MNKNLNVNEYRISITSGCNMKCVYCHNEGNKQKSSLDLKQIKSIVENSKDLGLSEVRLTGGDPLIHPQILDICQMLSEEFNLKVGINTNCILINKLFFMIKQGWINRVVVGLDYFDSPVSKNSSIGLSSKKILNNILQLKKLGCDVSIATVFCDNYDDVEKLVEWCINNKIRIKIIEEEKNEIAKSTSIEFLQMQNKILDKYKLNRIIDNLNEVNGYLDNFNVVSFFYSFCRLRRCDLCRQIQFRITSNGIAKKCLYYDNQDVNLFLGDDIHSNLIKSINMPIDYHFDESLIINDEKKLIKCKEKH